MKIILGFIALLVIGAGAWYYAGGDMSDLQGAFGEKHNEAVTPHPADNVQEFHGSLEDLLARPGAWQCDVSVTVQGLTTSGTVFAAGKKLRGDFTANVPQFGNMQTHLIATGDTLYTWTSLMDRGYKFPITGGSVKASGSDAETAAAFNQDYDYRCRSWTADETKFALPAGIVF